MMDFETSDKVKSPFSKSQRTQLLAWSKQTKKQQLLSGRDRKVLYDGGFYDHIFVSRLYHLNKTLDELSESLNDNQADVALEIKNTSYRCYLEAGAKANSPQIKYFLGEALFYGHFGFEENDEESLFWIESAADDGVADALVLLGKITMYGYCGVEKNLEKAKELLRIPAAEGSAEALLSLGLIFNQFWFLEKDERYKKIAFEHFEQAAEKGLDRAMRFLSNCYADGFGTEENEEKAFKLMNKAAETDPRAKVRLGEFFADGIGTMVDFNKAIELWREASEEEEAEAFLELGHCHRDGIVLEQSYELSYAMFERAAELGSRDGCYQLGLQQFFEEGCSDKEEEAFENFLEAYNRGELRAGYFLGCHYYDEEDYAKAIPYLQDAADEQEFSLVLLGNCARLGLGRKQSYEDALELYMQAAEYENHYAQMAIGRAFYLGEGVDEDNIEAVKWFELAVQQENPTAQFLLGECYFEGLGVEENLTEALKLLRASANNGNDRALEFLHANGFDLKEDDDVTLSEADTSTVVTLRKNIVARTKDLYARTTRKEFDHENNKDSDNVVELKIRVSNSLDRLMDPETD